MLIDATKLTDGAVVEADLCIVGGGLAGLAFASAFLDTDTTVILLESGPIGPDAEADDLSEGASTAHPYFPLSEGAPRRLGGAADTWGAWCRPFEPIDFESREWPWSGWPVSSEEMAPYFERARAYLEMSDRGFTGEAWADGLPPLYRHIQDETGLSSGRLAREPAGTDLRAGDGSAHRVRQSLRLPGSDGPATSELGADDASVIGIEAGAMNGRRFTVVATQYVLAGGTFGTTRLLLASRDRMKDGVGNQHGMVGRFFAEHPHIVAGRIALSKPAATGRPGFPAIDRGLGGLMARIEMERPRAGIRAGICLDEDLRRREEPPERDRPPASPECGATTGGPRVLPRASPQEPQEGRERHPGVVATHSRRFSRSSTGGC